MPRKRLHTPLRVLLNKRVVGYFSKAFGGAISFRYDEGWLDWDQAIPVSLSLPLREDVYNGAAVAAVFENLLPDADQMRRRVAEKVGAEGIDAYSLLSAIGRDCVGALQFVPEDDDHDDPTSGIDGETASDADIEKILNNLEQVPMGVDQDEDFRISIAGAQEKTALLWHEGKWWKPRGATPTSHIFKTQIGTLPNGIDLSNSVENEFYCLKLLAEFGLPVNAARMETFGETKVLVVERFDRRWTKDGRLIRLPQEDCCQALSIPPTRKYQSQGGPGMLEILKFLKASDTPGEDQKKFLKAQILFWLMGATDGHGKNFSIGLGSGGQFSLTPFYDVLTAQPNVDVRQIERKQFKMAMSVGDNRHYVMDQIRGRHFLQIAKKAGMPETLASEALQEVADQAQVALDRVGEALPSGFPESIHASVSAGLESRIKWIEGAG